MSVSGRFQIDHYFSKKIYFLLLIDSTRSFVFEDVTVKYERVTRRNLARGVTRCSSAKPSVDGQWSSLWTSWWYSASSQSNLVFVRREKFVVPKRHFSINRYSTETYYFEYATKFTKNLSCTSCIATGLPRWPQSTLFLLDNQTLVSFWGKAFPLHNSRNLIINA